MVGSVWTILWLSSRRQHDPRFSAKISKWHILPSLNQKAVFIAVPPSHLTDVLETVLYFSFSTLVFSFQMRRNLFDFVSDIYMYNHVFWRDVFACWFFFSTWIFCSKRILGWKDVNANIRQNNNWDAHLWNLKADKRESVTDMSYSSSGCVGQTRRDFFPNWFAMFQHRLPAKDTRKRSFSWAAERCCLKLPYIPKQLHQNQRKRHIVITHRIGRHRHRQKRRCPCSSTNLRYVTLKIHSFLLQHWASWVHTYFSANQTKNIGLKSFWTLAPPNLNLPEITITKFNFRQELVGINSRRRKKCCVGYRFSSE